MLRGSDVVLGDADTRHEGGDAGGASRSAYQRYKSRKVCSLCSLVQTQRQTPADSGVCLLSILIGFAWIF